VPEPNENAATPRQVGEARKREELAIEQEKKDIKEILSLPAGRRFFWMLLDGFCRIDEPVFTGNSKTYYNDGVRGVGILVKKKIKAADIGLWRKMEDEALKRAEKEKLAQRADEELAQE
jgi:hypothetical protein